MLKKQTVDLREAERDFSRLLELVKHGEEVTIVKGGKAMAKLSTAIVDGQRLLGMDTGRVFLADDFNEPLSDFGF